MRQQVERGRAFLAAETQFVVVWGGASGEPDIEGDVSLVIDAPLPRRVLGFGAWLSADQAQALEANVALLRERGQGFRQDLVGQAAAISKRRAAPSAAASCMRVRDVSGDRLELVRLRKARPSS